MKVRNHIGSSIIHLAVAQAAQLGNYYILDYVIKTGKVDINQRDDSGLSPLDYSMMFNDQVGAKLIQDHVNAPDNESNI